MAKSVIPLESNPEIFTNFATKLGLKQNLQFVDVYSIFDSELLSFIPRPSNGLILLFPITEKYEQFKSQEDTSVNHPAEGIVWYKQTVGNACGLYALLHMLSNIDEDKIVPGSKVEKFKQSRGDISKVEELIGEIEKEYTDFANEGSTETPDANDEVIFHFITFVEKDGEIFELDGRRKQAVSLGHKSDQSLDVLDDPLVVKRIEKYIELTDEANKLNFSIMSLSQN